MMLVMFLQIKCMRCGGKSERIDRMMDLTVEIDGNISTLEEALRQFTGTEILDGENKYQCSRLFSLLSFLKTWEYVFILLSFWCVMPILV